MSRLADLFPTPKAMTLGGGRWLASEFRLRDLALMESWASARSPDPIAQVLELPPGSPGRRKALRAAFDLADRGLPGVESGTVSALLSTPEGLAFSLWLSIGRSHPDFTLITADETVASMTEDEWSAFDRVAWGLDIYELIDAEINAECGVTPPPKLPGQENTTWAEAWLSTRMPLERFGDLSLSQWRAVASGGGKPDRSVPVPTGWTMERFRAEYLKPRKAFFMEKDEEEGRP